MGLFIPSLERTGVIPILLYLLDHPEGKRKVDFRDELGLGPGSAQNAQRICFNEGLITVSPSVDEFLFCLTEKGRHIAHLLKNIRKIFQDDIIPGEDVLQTMMILKKKSEFHNIFPKFYFQIESKFIFEDFYVFVELQYQNIEPTKKQNISRRAIDRINRNFWNLSDLGMVFDGDLIQSYIIVTGGYQILVWPHFAIRKIRIPSSQRLYWYFKKIFDSDPEFENQSNRNIMYDTVIQFVKKKRNERLDYKSVDLQLRIKQLSYNLDGEPPEEEWEPLPWDIDSSEPPV